MILEPVLAHAGGIDEIALLIGLPVALYFSIRWFTRRAERGQRQPEQGDTPEGPSSAE